MQKKSYKKTEAVVLLNPERQPIRKEGNVLDAGFLWYSAARACNRNCFDRAEVARVMNAAGFRCDTLPQDIRAGLERGLVDPEVLKSSFELDQQPIVAELTRRFQGFRERWLTNPRFLQRLAIEEAISVSTTLLAQYQRRREPLLERNGVCDYRHCSWSGCRFLYRLATCTYSLLPVAGFSGSGGFFEGFATLLGTVPDNDFQRARQE